MTAPVFAQFASRFGCRVVLVRTVRFEPARFRTVWESLLATPAQAIGARTCTLMRAVDAMLQRWIWADPNAWLWLHRCWTGKPCL